MRQERGTSQHAGGRARMDRRRFMTAAGAVAGTFTVMKAALVRGTQANSKIQLGLLGCGMQGKWIADLFAKHGNVSEWCRDTYVAAYPQKEVADPAGPAEDSYKVIRGGSWDHFPPSCRSAARNSAPPAYWFRETGFRVVLEVTQ